MTPRDIQRFIQGALIATIFLLPHSSFGQTPFYQGKTITVIATTAPGGTGDLRVKALVPFLRKYVPGNPTIIIEYMDGGGGRKGANYLFRNAKPDGLTIGATSGSIVALQLMRETGVMYDIDKFIQLGSPESTTHYVISREESWGLAIWINCARLPACASAPNPSDMFPTSPGACSRIFLA